MTMTTASLLVRAHDGVVDEPDRAARPRRRRFTAEYKAQILDEYDALAPGSTERGALLRREGLYTSHIAEWRKARDAGARDALAPKAKGRRSAEQVELDLLRRKTQRLEAELKRTKTALEITGKVHALLEQLSEWAGHEVLDLPANEWTLAKNDQWVQSVIDRKMPVYVGSNPSWQNLWDAAAGRTTVFGRELGQFLNAGYTWDSWTLVPPGGG